MYWNGDRWLPQEPERVAKPAHRSYRRFRDWAATGIMVVVLAGLTLPFGDADAATISGTTLIANWSADSNVSVVQEGSLRVGYKGTWRLAYHKSYLGGKVRSTDLAGARAALKFKGNGIAWVGPMGPTRGKAKVYIDGALVTTVDTRAASFRPTRVLFQRTWKSIRWHTITIVTSGTAGRPTVALDAFVQRRGPKSTTTSAPTPTPAATTAPTATAAASTAPTAAPSANPTPTIAPAPTPTPTPTPTPVTSGAAYGSAIGADSLANTQVGGQYNLMTSYRFRAQTSSALNSVRIYVVDGTGYAAGTGGSVEVSIQTDDGTSSHLPTGTRLASTTIRTGNPVSIGYLPLVAFATPPKLTAGTHYHVVFRNLDASPTVNFVSVNSLIVRQPPSPQQPRFADLDWTQLMKAGNGSWTVRSGFTPILALNYANGRQDGQGYMEVWIRGYERIAGASYMARESFTVAGGNRTVSSVGVRLKRTGGTSPLVIRLETAAGVKLAETTVPAASIAVQAPDSFGYPATWATAALSSPVTLAAGQRYNLRLSTASGTEYSVYAIRQGVDYGFGSTTHFGNGLAYRTVNGGSTWETFGYGGAHYGQSDLQFFLR